MNDKEQTHFEDRQVLEKEETTQLIKIITKKHIYFGPSN